jgi:hypothetical protein
MLKKQEKTILAVKYFIYDSKKISFDFLLYVTAFDVHLAVA